MGSYNPTSPQDIGQEWCPIRNEDLLFSPAVNAFEVGHSFTLAQSRTLQDARCYARDLPNEDFMNQPLSVSIYPVGLEDQSGPIRRVVIPCNNGTVTGASLLNSTSIANAMFSPADNQALLFGSSGDSVQLYFAATAYTSPLAGKRILGVNFLYRLDVGASGIPFDVVDDAMPLVLHKTNLNIGGSAFFGYLDGSEAVDLKRKALGDINHFWTANAPENTSDRMPYIFADLLRFERTNANPISVWITLANSISPQSMSLGYAALEVIYCEEQRVATGIRLFGGRPVSTLTAATPYVYGANIVPLNTLTYTANPVLAAGAYTAVLSTANAGDLLGNIGDLGPVSDFPYPILNALRELYSIPTHPGVQVNLPFPTTDAIVGRTFTQQQTHILPQLSIHTSGGPLTEEHVYGRQSAAQVYGTITASQGIVNTAPANTAFPMVRFYARRFGATTSPLTIRAQATPTIFASITVAAFDALPEILDGWKQVDLTFAAPTPSFTSGGAVTTYEWVASSEVAGSRWEVLGAIAPAISGVPGNLLNLVPAPQQLDTATYGGTSAVESWLSPTVASTTADTTADATVIFAQSMPIVSGFALSAASQVVTGIGIDCGVPAGCIPSGIGFHALSWLPPAGSAIDLFTRTSSASFGTATSGQPYTVVGTAADFNVNGTQGVILPSATASDRTAVINVGGADHDLFVDILAPTLLSSSSLLAGVITRYIDSNNFYWADLDMNTTGNMTVRVKKKVAGVTTTIALGNFPEPAAAGVTYRLRAQAAGTALRAKVWAVTQPEPLAWRVDTTDTSLTTGPSVGVYAQNQSVTLTVSAVFDNLYSEPMGFGTFEIQRMDALDGVWQTIMLGSNAATVLFNDYEARVGILSSYRIRQCDVYNFCGPWSATITGTLAAPGVAGTDGVGVLIFTSNYRQAGNINLAYTQQWENNVEEPFDFREPDNVKLQQMYNRDYVNAFRPLERGGESFTRTVLVQAASVSLKVLEDVFKSLRDMAWDAVPYVCVRNELGDRWLATVIVPDGVVRRNRRLQLARIQVIETTETPYPVNPA